jgi:EmrB/QacA subfamily drug resistance transporter
MTTKRAARAWALPVVAAAQLLVVLDGTIVNIALPSAQADLGMTDANRHWAITAYLLAFGGLLLIGGRISGVLGHRRAFAVGLAGFAAASALGGLATEPGMLFGARALQGVFAALLAPAALALLTVAYTEPRERGRAFGVFAAIGAAGSAVGLIAGGLLTEYATWQWCLYINVPIAALALAGTPLLPASRPEPSGRLDVPGALLSTAGFAAIVYAFNEAEPRGWASPIVLGLLAAGVALLAAFALVEARSADPLLPLRVLAHRLRAGAFASISLMFLAMFGFYLFMSYYTQAVLGYTPFQAGLILIVNALAALVGSMLIAGRLYGRVPNAALILPGLGGAAAGMLLLTGLDTGTANVLPLYLMPAMVLTGLGLGLVITPTAILATAGTRGHEIGAASAAYNAAQQLGAALGIALLNTIAAGAAAARLSDGAAGEEAAVHGYTTALAAAAAVLIVAAFIAAILLRTGRAATAEPHEAEREPALNRS